MDKRFFAAIALIAAVTMVSCNDDNDEGSNNGVNIDSFGLLLDGGSIKSISLYCLERGVSTYDEPTIFQYYQKVKTFNDFSQIDFRIMLNWSGHSNQGNQDTLYARELIENEYDRQKSGFLQTAYKKYEKYAKNGWPTFLTAYVNGQVTLTCDKDLYGEKAGADISKYFSIFGKSYCIPQGIEEPIMRYNFCDVQPTVMSNYFINKSWLQPEYYNIYPLQNPAEKYDEIVFTLTMPMIVESTWDYAVAKYSGLNEDVKRTEKIFTTECTIKFAQ